MSTELYDHIEPELHVNIPRRARLRTGYQVLLGCIAMFAIAVACIIGWYGYHDVSDLAALRADGVTGQAEVTAKSEVHGKSTSYYLSYSLQAPGISIEDKEEVSSSLYLEKRQGDTMTLTYLPSHPQTHRVGLVGDDRVGQEGMYWTLGLLGWIGLLGACLGAMAYVYAKELRLLRYGMPAHGVIEWVQPPTNSKVTDYAVKYRFNVPHGEQIQTCAVPGSVGKQLSADQTVTVLYDPNNVCRSYPYCALRYTELASRV